MEESSIGDGLELDRWMDTAGAAAGHATDDRDEFGINR
jgi:hypothetical protein